MVTLNRVLTAIPLRYLARKILLMFLLLWGITTLIFILVELSPGTAFDKFISPDLSPDLREMLIRERGLDKPAFVRYFKMIWGLLTLDAGVSLVHERPVFDLVFEALPNTLLLSSITLLVIYPFGILTGILQAVFQGRLFDTGASLVTLFFYSMPGFWLALMLQILAVQVGLPTSGMHDAVMYDYMSPSEQWWDGATHLLLPGVAMGMASAAGVARYMRSSLLEVIRQDYIRTARAKGLHESTVILKHALRNALLPIVTLVGMSFRALIGGSIIIEVVFAWPGMGRLIIDSIYQQDVPVIVGCFLLYAFVVAMGNLLADITYALVDPRIRYQ